jgi:dipeptidase
VPDGYVTGHANQARITTFPLEDPSTTLYSADVISFARSPLLSLPLPLPLSHQLDVLRHREIGLYDGSDAAFSFSDVYDPVTFSGARVCEARVWSFFSAVMGAAWSAQYLSYAQGVDLTNRMPLWVKPEGLVSLAEVMQYMRSHYEGTALDMSGTSFSDVGAGAFYAPVRNSPLTWSASSAKGKQFLHERAIAVGLTGWSIVCQARPNMPDALTAVLW